MDALGQDKQKSHIIINVYFLCLSSPSACLALQHGSFLPREWPIVLVETNTLRSILLDVLVKICKNEQTSYLFVTNKQLNFSTHH